MTLEEWNKKATSLRRAATRARNNYKKFGGSLADKLELYKIANAKQAQLTQHALNFYELVDA